jgi:hypothetical protein
MIRQKNEDVTEFLSRSSSTYKTGSQKATKVMTTTTMTTVLVKVKTMTAMRR